MYESNGQYSHCLYDITEALTEIDLSEVPESYNIPGEKILGCLDELGWVVVRGVRVSGDTNEAITALSNIGRKKNWHSIESGDSNRMMKYDHTEKVNRV